MTVAALIEASAAYAEAMSAIHRSAFPPREGWGADAIAIQLGLPGGFGLLDPRGGMILARVVADEAEVLTLAVAAPVRRRGIGAALLSAAMQSAACRGAKTMFLEVSTANAPALALYSTVGFRAVGQRRGYYADGSDASLLRADFSPCAEAR
ncbi:MAG TPA: GNAT family N-acetyltransferase [Acetobacteraceae bacterium]|nr:GNAT family N-acetyltransferase [Acetobacteraceae bacterium]